MTLIRCIEPCDNFLDEQILFKKLLYKNGDRSFTFTLCGLDLFKVLPLSTRISYIFKSYILLWNC